MGAVPDCNNSNFAFISHKFQGTRDRDKGKGQEQGQRTSNRGQQQQKRYKGQKQTALILHCKYSGLQTLNFIRKDLEIFVGYNPHVSTLCLPDLTACDKTSQPLPLLYVV